MAHLNTPLKLGKFTLKNRVLYSPLAGCSDYPFRKMVARYRPGLMYCEMVKMDAIVRHDPGTFHLLDFDRDMHPIGAQLCGSKPKIAGQAARIIEDLGFDVLDLNCGCPVDKVIKDGSGSGMLKTPELIGEVLAEMVAAVSIPVTVKIRAGWDDDTINAVEVTRIAEQAGAKAICIHGRTRSQGYKGPAKWDYIKACKEAAKEIVVIGNGDIMDGAAGVRMMESTGCDAVMASRGTMGQPWIVEDILQAASGEQVRQRSIDEYRQALLDHFHYTIDYVPEGRALLDMRRVGCWYFKKSYGTSEFRGKISRAGSLDEARDLIRNFAFAPLSDSATCGDEESCE